MSAVRRLKRVVVRCNLRDRRACGHHHLGPPGRVDKAVLKRRCEVEDLAEVIVFLGFGATMITGQTIVVDGGLTL
jgi:NAD(P)-dependent dehydrogenase (short-subunit alcohol dehydrogenase family)